ncbi:TetR/AcrR family transcriptional regulator C-terminal ligand-binding domain-containing protein [Microbacterium sp.]|uniref:TetR/AcrR family transcriptional regulator n=1 Tax=Microbacterium sp. TaxID=51671 RepID=UPI0033407E11
MKTSAGRPRKQAIDDALRGAFGELFAEGGATGITMQDLIGRAGTSRDAFYRRFHSVGHFLVHLMTSRYAVDPTEDTGTLRGDLLVILRDQVAMYTDGVSRALLPLLLDACARDEVVAGLLRDRFLHPQRESTTRVIERAVARGEIRPVGDLSYVLDLVYGPLLLRAALPGDATIDDDLAELIAGTVLRELGAGDEGERGS